MSTSDSIGGGAIDDKLRSHRLDSLLTANGSRFSVSLTSIFSRRAKVERVVILWVTLQLRFAMPEVLDHVFKIELVDFQRRPLKRQFAVYTSIYLYNI